MSDLQRDIERMDLLMQAMYPDGNDAGAAWQRIRARLTPDRERVARAIDVALNGSLLQAEAFDAADAAIAAMEGKNDHA